LCCPSCLSDGAEEEEEEALPKRQSRRQKETSSLLLIQSLIGAARASRSRRHRNGGVEAPALEVGRERGGLEDAARQVRQHMRGERALGAGAHVVEALDDDSLTSGACAVTERSSSAVNQLWCGAGSRAHTRASRLAVLLSGSSMAAACLRLKALR
jgi:hypothetical protein